jgi:predicted O-methyltransferase YrrM
MNIHYLKNLIRHYIQAILIDVLHSPFVYKLYKTSIKKQKNIKSFETIEKLRQKLKNDNDKIAFDEIGAGSNFSRTKNMLVSEIAKKHAKPKRIAEILYYVALNNHCSYSIELGTSLGISTAYLTLAHKERSLLSDILLTSVEGNKSVIQKAKSNLVKLQLDGYVNLVEGNFDTILDEILKQYPQLDLAFIDGNHNKEATLKYFKQMLPLVHNNSVCIFDDIYWSKGMTEAWNEIKKHHQVTVTVDLFFIGLVFFRQEQAKQDFKLRVF